jgi:prepilin-type N-terminal cleavage/methylation domain-containing protein
MNGIASRCRCGRSGFTLLELVVVIAIIAVLLALLLPAVQAARMSALRAETTNNLHQCSLAAITFHDVNNFLPYNGTGTANGSPTSGSWAYQILPYIEQQALYDTQDGATSPPDSWSTAVGTLLDPMRGRHGYFDYGGVLPPPATVTITIGTNTQTTSVPLGTTSAKITVPNNSTYSIQIPTTSLSGVTLELGTTVLEWRSNPAWGASGTFLIAGSWQYMGTISSIACPGGETVAGAPANIQNYALPTFGNSPNMISIAGTTSNNPSWGSYVQLTTVSPPLSSSGPATDFGINPFINSPPRNVKIGSVMHFGGGGALNAANAYVALQKIPDGTSATILLGEMYLAIGDYQTITPAQSMRLPIFVGGTAGTSRNGLGANSSSFRQDGTVVTASQWGSPMSEGALFAMADGSVQLIPYTTDLTDLLYPNDGNAVTLP